MTLVSVSETFKVPSLCSLYLRYKSLVIPMYMTRLVVLAITYTQYWWMFIMALCLQILRVAQDDT